MNGGEGVALSREGGATVVRDPKVALSRTARRNSLTEIEWKELHSLGRREGLEGFGCGAVRLLPQHTIHTLQ